MILTAVTAVEAVVHKTTVDKELTDKIVGSEAEMLKCPVESAVVFPTRMGSVLVVGGTMKTCLTPVVGNTTLTAPVIPLVVRVVC